MLTKQIYNNTAWKSQLFNLNRFLCSILRQIITKRRNSIPTQNESQNPCKDNPGQRKNYFR